MASRTVLNNVFCLITLSLSLSLSLASECYPLDSYRKQASSYTVCRFDMDNEEKLNATESCDYTLTLPDDCSSSCQKICGKLLDSVSGTVKFTFPFLKNNYESYKVYLCNSSMNCHSTHSEEITLTSCDGLYCKKNCSKMLNVVFQYVNTGFYYVKVVPYKGNTSQIPVMSTKVKIKTKYFRDLNPNLRVDCNDSSCLVQVYYEKCPAGFILGLFHNRNKLLQCNAESTYKDIVCVSTQEGGTATGTCSLSPDHQVIMKCNFNNLKENSNYSVEVEYDEPCYFRSDNGALDCQWKLFFETSSRHTPLGENNNIPDTTVLLCIFLLAAVVIVATILWRRKHKPPTKLPGGTTPITSTPLPVYPSVLLLYARDCRPFSQAVDHLKLVLRQSYFKVEDFWEDSQYSEVSQNPYGWLHSRLTDKHVMVVLVTNLPSLLQEAALLRGASKQIKYRNSKAFDSLFTFALSKLHHASTSLNNPYTKIHVVSFDDAEKNRFPHLRSLISTEVRYVLPIHLNTLMTRLYNLNTYGSINVTEDELTSAISQYCTFLEDKPQYFYELFVPENFEMIQQILTEDS